MHSKQARLSVILAATLLLLAQAPSASASASIVLICDACQTVSEFTAAIFLDMIARRNMGDTSDRVYMVISEADAKIALAETSFEVDPWLGILLPNVTMWTNTEEDMAFLDQYLMKRAALDKSHVDELPFVTYPGANVFVGSGAYQNTAYLYMNGHPAVTSVQLGEELAWNAFMKRVSSFGSRIKAALGAAAFNVYIKIVFADGSYGVFAIVDSTTAGVHEVYYVDKDGNVFVIDEDLLEGVDDPNLVDPDVTGDIEDVPHGADTTFLGGGAPSGEPHNVDSIHVWVPFPSTGGKGRHGRVLIEDCSGEPCLRE